MVTNEETHPVDGDPFTQGYWEATDLIRDGVWGTEQKPRTEGRCTLPATKGQPDTKQGEHLTLDNDTQVEKG